MDVSKVGRKPVPLGLVGALVLVVLVEALVAAHPLAVTSPSRFEWRQARDAATALAPRAAILGLGSSMTKQGLYSPVVERESGRPTLNLAQCGGRTQTAYYLLRHALAAGARPEAVLLEVHPIYLTVPLDGGMRAWPDLLDWGDQADLAWRARDTDLAIRTALDSLLPSVRSRFEIRDLIARALRRDVNFNRDVNTALVRHFDLNGGASVNRRPTPFDGEVHPFIEGMYVPATWRPDPQNARYLRRVLGLCRSRQIPVYWLVPPLAPRLQAIREARGLEAAYDAFMGRIRADYPEVAVIDARRSGYPPAAFLDAAHLQYDGAAVFSAEVGRSLRRDLAEHPRPRANAPRIDLPPYRIQPIGPPLEDMAGTGRIVAEAATRATR